MDKSTNSEFSSFYCSVFMIPVRALYWPIIDPRELLGTWVRIGVFPVSQYMRKRGKGTSFLSLLHLSNSFSRGGASYPHN